MISYRVGKSSLLFVETEAFTERVRELLDEDTYRAFQRVLVQNPEKGAVMAGCGGLRKVRVEEPRRGKGKRGGWRLDKRAAKSNEGLGRERAPGSTGV